MIGMRKAIVFTLDALFAIAVTTMLLLAAAGIVARLPPSSLGALGLQRMESDALASMDKGGVFLRALEQGNAAEIRSFLLVLPPRVCATTTVTTYPSGAIALADSTGCQCNGPRVAVSRALARVNQAGSLENYIAAMTGCYA